MIKSYLRQCWQLSRAGFLSAGYKMVGITAVFMLVFGRYLGAELEVLIFILTPIGLMLDFDASKYVLSCSLPVKMKYRLHMLHYITILDSLLAVTCTHLSYIAGGMSRSIKSDYLIFLIDLISCNFYYYHFCSPEFKKDILDEDKRQLIYQCIIGGAAGFGIAVRMKYGLNTPVYLAVGGLSPLVKGVMLLSLTIAAVIWTYKSMMRLEHVVRSK